MCASLSSVQWNSNTTSFARGFGLISDVYKMVGPSTDCRAGTGLPACSGRSLTLVADQLLEGGFKADGVQVGVTLCGVAKLVRHLESAPEVTECVTRPAAATLAAGEVVEQHGILRSGCDQGA